MDSIDLPPLPSDFSSVGASNTALPGLPSIPSLMGNNSSNIIGQALSSFVGSGSSSSTANSTTPSPGVIATSDGFITKITMLALGLVLIGGGIYIFGAQKLK